jgi:hypothetical protein
MMTMTRRGIHRRSSARSRGDAARARETRDQTRRRAMRDAARARDVVRVRVVVVVARRRVTSLDDDAKAIDDVPARRERARTTRGGDRGV